MVTPALTTSLRLFLALLLAVGAERVAELLLSARNARRAFARGGRETGQAHFRVMAAAHALFLPACFAEAWLLGRAAPASWPLALAGALAAQGLRWWAIAALGDRWNVRIVFVPGDEPITAGPYRFLRHPNYLAVALELCCLPLVHGAWIACAAFTAVNAALLAVRIRAEERALGPRYQERFAGVGRLFPGGGRG